ncbi:MAG: sigma 54-interacting transcriptional regulator [Candidatus Celaenobacter antarcticus]|nr:sigma 54-interacting transcriptional regulator [Candidatus Celaenobacter antarcticus]
MKEFDKLTYTYKGGIPELANYNIYDELERLEERFTHLRDNGSYLESVKCAKQIVRIYQNIGDKERVREHTDYIEERIKKDKNIERELKIKMFLAQVYCDVQNVEEAIGCYIEVLENKSGIYSKSELIECYGSLAKLYALNDEFEKAYVTYKQYIEKKIIELKHTQDTEIRKLHSLFNTEINTRIKRRAKLLHEMDFSKQRYNELQNMYNNIQGIEQLGIFSNKMMRVIEEADLYHEDRETTVLIEGETGTGKELVARIIHFGKECNNNAPFIAVNCSAIPDEIFESELFGYKENSFTDARKHGKAGLVELAHNGTLLLDEVGDIPLEMQSKILHFLETKKICRIGETTQRVLNVRIISSTNKDLKKMVEMQTFRRDLYHRLNPGYIYIPPLRERKEEILPLAQMFLLYFAKEKRKNFKSFDNESAQLLQNYSWPGNTRELRNTIERVVLLYNEMQVIAHHIDSIHNCDGDKENDEGMIKIEIPEDRKSFTTFEVEIIKKFLETNNSNVTRTAECLNISRNKVYKYAKQILR